MPEFVASLLVAAAPCLALLALNGPRRLPARTRRAPRGLDAGGAAWTGGVLAPARAAHGRAPRRRPG